MAQRLHQRLRLGYEAVPRGCIGGERDTEALEEETTGFDTGW
jgi:hypothetical protein